MFEGDAGRIMRHLGDVEVALKQFALSCSRSVLQASELLVTTFHGGGKLLICGNGGSSADALHMAAELVSSFGHGLSRPALPAIALPSNIAAITAYANDFDYAGVFARQVEAFGRQGDTLLAISTSGESENIVRACEAARQAGLRVVALTGPKHSRLEALSDVIIAVPGTDTQVIQTLHLMVEHILCGYIEDAFS